MRRSVAILAIVCMAGCRLPNKAMRADYASYNQTIQHNQSQQMLLNLVRLKYRETPFFMKVGALSASYSYSMDGSANFAVGGRSKAYGARFGAAYSTRPTITYTPLEGDTFVQQVLSEVEHSEFILLLRSGWPADTLCSVLVERIGRDANDRSDPTYQRFRSIVDALSEAQRAGDLSFGTVAGIPVIQFQSDRVVLGEELREESSKLHTLPMDSFQLRSLFDVMFFLSKNTVVPEDHAAMVRSSTPNNWMTIQSSKDEPDNSMVWVRHRGYYFSIENTDLQTKDTFALLKLLYQLQAGDVQTMQPLLTIPLGLP